MASRRSPCHINSMSSPADPLRVFDRRAVRVHRARAARAPQLADFLVAESAERLLDRLDDVLRRFPLALDLGCRDGVLARLLRGRGGIETLIHADAAFEFARQAPPPRLVAEAGALLQLRRCLKPDGLLLAALFGGDTLVELRGALMEAELAEEGGASPRVSPVADVRDLGMLLQRAGFALPVVDSERVTVTYPDALALMRDLRAMGETNAVVERRRGFTRRSTLARAAALYAERHGRPDGRIAARFEIITLTAWAPHESQPKPLKPGSARARLAEALGTEEKPAGEKAGRPLDRR